MIDLKELSKAEIREYLKCCFENGPTESDFVLESNRLLLWIKNQKLFHSETTTLSSIKEEIKRVIFERIKKSYSHCEFSNYVSIKYDHEKEIFKIDFSLDRKEINIVIIPELK